MRRLAALLLTVVLLVGTGSALAAGAPAPVNSLSEPAVSLQTETNASAVTPGQRLAGVIGASQAEFEGSIELRAYNFAFARAPSNASKAKVVGERLERVRERLAALERRRASLERAHANGSISDGTYRARVTALTARSQQLEQLLDASQARADSLPDAVLAANGVNATAIRTLRARAGNLTGPEVAAIAREIAGRDVGRPIDRGPPAEVGGPPEDAPGRSSSPTNRSQGRESVLDPRTGHGLAETVRDVAQTAWAPAVGRT